MDKFLLKKSTWKRMSTSDCINRNLATTKEKKNDRRSILVEDLYRKVFHSEPNIKEINSKSDENTPPRSQYSNNSCFNKMEKNRNEILEECTLNPTEAQSIGGISDATIFKLITTSQQSKTMNVSNEEQEKMPVNDDIVHKNSQQIDIKEVMKNIVIYVEVRTGEDNRSGGIKKVISLLGAKVNDRFLKDTTHVVFKDGLLTTYNKAKKWNIPIVSILWIESCKKNLRLMDPILYPISNLDRYENPELYKKLRRMKSMQPDAEDHCRKPKTVNSKKLIELTEPKSITKIRMPKKPKDNLNNIFEEFQEKLMLTPDDDFMPFQSKLLERIRNSPCTPRSKNSRITTKYESSKKLSFIDSISEKSNNSRNNSDDMNVRAQSDNKKEDCSKEQLNISKINKRKSVQKLNEVSQPTLKSQPRQTNQKSLTKNSTPAIAKTNTARQSNAIIEKDFNNLVKPKIDEVKTSNKSIETSQIEKFSTPNLIKTTRRRTLFTPNQMEFSNSFDKIQNKNNQTNHSEEPILLKTPIISKQVLEFEASTPQSLVKETTNIICDTPLPFNSAKKPMTSRRRTLFDMSMDIIDHRLHNINKVSKINQSSIDCNSNNIDNSLGNLKAISEINVIPDNQELFRKNETIAMTKTPDVSAKKRKLFVPDQMYLTPPSDLLKQNELLNKLKLSSTIKRNLEEPNSYQSTTPKDKKRRTTMHSNITQQQFVNSLSMQKQQQNRRSSFDFEIKNFDGKSQLKHANNVSKNENIISNVIVCTNMHKTEIECVKKAVDKLGGFEINAQVTDKTTHVITLETRRTINLLRGIIRGLWILNYDWIIDSSNAGKWIHEEQYELRNFSRAVQICRSERQAFGNKYKMEIFMDIPSIFVSQQCEIPSDCIKELIVLCSGRIVNEKDKAKYVIGELYKDKICLKPHWILDCISNSCIKKINKYIIN